MPIRPLKNKIDDEFRADANYNFSLLSGGVQGADPGAASLTYDSQGRLTKVEYDTRTEELTYDNQGRLSQVKTITSESTITETLNYDSNGRLTGTTREVS